MSRVSDFDFDFDFDFNAPVLEIFGTTTSGNLGSGDIKGFRDV